MSTLRSLLLVSRQFRYFAEPVFLGKVTVVDNLRSDTSPLIPFREFISSNGRRCLHVKDFKVSFPGTEPSVQDMHILEEIIPKLHQLESLSIRAYRHMYSVIEHEPFTLFSNPSLDFSLKRFSFVFNDDDELPNFSRFLASQTSLEHLELYFSSEVAAPVFPNLRHLLAPFEFAAAVLSSTDGITCLHTTFDYHSLVHAVFESHLDDLQTLSCHVLRTEPFYAFVSLAKNIKSLHILTFREWSMISDVSGTQIDHFCSLLGGLHGDRVEHIRFLLDSSEWTAVQVRRLFESASFLPSLRCIEVQKVLPQDDELRLDSSLVSRRWYLAQKDPVVVEWRCFVGDEWFHDWDKDVRVLSTR